MTPEHGVSVREAAGLADLEAIAALFNRVWDGAPDSSQITVALLRAFSMTGNYVAVAFVGEHLAGAAVGFLAPHNGSLHSHITGVEAKYRGRQIGYLLKCHQRDWALGRGIGSITWTFDPLVRRNAYFNLVKLGARATDYLPDCYGPMHDGLNRGEASDRLFVEWDLLSPAAAGPPEGDHRPLITVRDDALRVVPWTGGPAFVPVPEDIERFRVENPLLARAWRAHVRDVLAGALADGAEIAAFDRRHGYLITYPAKTGER